MPYIKRDIRKDLAERKLHPINAGELNYTISDIVDEYLVKCGLRYSTLNDVIGVLECLKMEVYRRIAAPYEDTKIKENGDVFTVNSR